MNTPKRLRAIADRLDRISFRPRMVIAYAGHIQDEADKLRVLANEMERQDHDH